LGDIILGVDIGTSGCKVVAIDSESGVLGSVTVPYDIKVPSLGWAEQDPEEWYRAFVLATRKIMEKTSILPRNIKAIGIDGMMNSPVFLNKELKPLRPCILWLDQRSKNYIPYISNLFKEHNIISPLPITPVVALAKIIWVMREEPKTWKETYKVIMPKDYIRFRLTGNVATDPSDASATLMFDGKKYHWADFLEDIFKVDTYKLPEIKPSSEIAGFVTTEASSITGLLEGTPVITGCSDGAADALGAGLIDPFDTLVRLGTSGAIFMVFDEYVPDDKQRYFILAHAIHNKWLIHQMFPFGIPHKWFFETFYKQEMEIAKAKNVNPFEYIEYILNADSPEGLLFIPNAGYIDDPSYFYGMFIGIRDIHTKSHFALALLQGLVFALIEALEPINEKFKPNMRTIRLIGGGSRSSLLRKMISTSLKSTVITPELHDASIGSAILAGVGARIFSSYKEAINRIVKIKEEVHPIEELYEKYRESYERYKEIKRKVVSLV
jgi:xylulokinase